MASRVLEVRMGESLRTDASSIAGQPGLDLPTAMRVFPQKMVAEGPFPSHLRFPKDRDAANEGLAAMSELGRRALANGTADMSLDEMEAEIAAVRTEREAGRA